MDGGSGGIQLLLIFNGFYYGTEKVHIKVHTLSHTTTRQNPIPERSYVVRQLAFGKSVLMYIVSFNNI